MDAATEIAQLKATLLALRDELAQTSEMFKAACRIASACRPQLGEPRAPCTGMPLRAMIRRECCHHRRHRQTEEIMTPAKRKELQNRSSRLGKTIAAVRFAIKHAGTGRAGAPKEALTKERRAELRARIEALEAERAELRSRLEAGAGEPKPPRPGKKAAPRKKATETALAAEHADDLGPGGDPAGRDGDVS